MSEEQKQYMIIKFGWEHIILPIDKGVAMLEALANCEIVKSEWVDGKTTWTIGGDRQEVTVKFISEAEYLAMKIQGGGK